ncbi:MAG: hypothetical protein WCY62_01925 [Clostridia bacterium]
MRKVDVFGKKLTRFSIFVWIAGFFVIILAGYFLILNLHVNQLDALEQEKQLLQIQIDSLLTKQEEEKFYNVEDIIQYLPNTFNQNQTGVEIELLRNLSGLSDANNYKITFTQDASSPFTQTLPSTVKFVSISISMTAPDIVSVFTFIRNIQNQNNIYYIKSINISLNTNGSASVQLVIYTFYNDVQI